MVQNRLPNEDPPIERDIENQSHEDWSTDVLALHSLDDNRNPSASMLVDEVVLQA